ncbi:MAG: hypothetical protein JWM40_1071 [Frankiales bacterium]|nr:hypothetical protein [Frankiales bacterium]
MARTPAAAAPAPARPLRRKPELAWLRAGDARLVISHQDAQDRRILKALDALVGSKPATPRRRGIAA